MAKAEKLNTDSVYDFVIRNYGSLSSLRGFLNLNGFTTLEEFDDVPIGAFLAISGTFREADEVEFTNYKSDSTTDYTGRDKKQPNQNLFDYVLTHYGSLENLGQFVLENDLTTLGDIGGLYNYETSPIGTKFILDRSVRTPFTTRLRDERKFVATDADDTGLVLGDYSKLDYNIDFR